MSCVPFGLLFPPFSLAQRLVKLPITILKYHSWYLCQISLLIMLLPILTPWYSLHFLANCAIVWGEGKVTSFINTMWSRPNTTLLTSNNSAWVSPENFSYYNVLWLLLPFLSLSEKNMVAIPNRFTSARFLSSSYTGRPFLQNETKNE